VAIVFVLSQNWNFLLARKQLKSNRVAFRARIFGAFNTFDRKIKLASPNNGVQVRNLRSIGTSIGYEWQFRNNEGGGSGLSWDGSEWGFSPHKKKLNMGEGFEQTIIFQPKDP